GARRQSRAPARVSEQFVWRVGGSGAAAGPIARYRRQRDRSEDRVGARYRIELRSRLLRDPKHAAGKSVSRYRLGGRSRARPLDVAGGQDMTDVYTKVVLTVIALALAALALRPIVAPGRVDALAPSAVQSPEQMAQRLEMIEHNADVMRAAANTNAHRTNERFAKQGAGVDIVLVDVDGTGAMRARPEPALPPPPQPPPNPL